MTSTPILSTARLAMTLVAGSALAACAATSAAPAFQPAVAAQKGDLARNAIHAMTGCYIVDYNYHETKALKDGYVLDERGYDVNKKKTIMEWIVALDESPTHIRLQHVLFARDDKGNVMSDSMIRHQAEDWELDPSWVWEYEGHSQWKRLDTHEKKGLWVRRITNLDDGLRYQCLAPWKLDGARAEWQCGDNFAPIPGRETRDMKRKDYQALVRDTRLLVFPSSWVERQENVKTAVADDGKREPMADEEGRNWYIRAADSECKDAAKFADDHMAFWKLLESVWLSYFTQNAEWHETPPGKASEPRFSRIEEVEDKHPVKSATDPQRAEAEKAIRAIIDADRVQ